MKRFVVIAVAAMLIPATLFAQETPRAMVSAYDALADAILSVKRAENGFVRTLLEHHRQAAWSQLETGHYDKAAAHMALYANEGDNAVAGIRKRLLEGGHHHNADGEAKGVYEPGYVIVTRQAKKQILAAAAEMRTASNRGDAEAAWSGFERASDGLIESLD